MDVLFVQRITRLCQSEWCARSCCGNRQARVSAVLNTRGFSCLPRKSFMDQQNKFFSFQLPKELITYVSLAKQVVLPSLAFNGAEKSHPTVHLEGGVQEHLSTTLTSTVSSRWFHTQRCLFETQCPCQVCSPFPDTWSLAFSCSAWVQGSPTTVHSPFQKAAMNPVVSYHAAEQWDT